MTPALRDAAQRMVSIPMDGMVDSLNVAVATGILLFALSAKR
jgi:tRNA G18 (ribose-2'-O)-methylase SpoU